MFKCKLCEVEYKSLQSLAKHIKGTHKMCSEDYYVNVLGNARGVCVCTLPTKFRNLNVGYNKHCSAKCSYHDPDVTKLRESTNIKRYGNIHPIAVDSVKDKVKCTVTDRYGVDHISKSREIRSKIETTNLIKYGDVCVLGSDLIKSKIRETNIEKYGGHPTTNAIVKAKIITTCMNRYDAPSPLQSNEIKCKIHETNILRYNGNPQSNDIVKERTRDTIIDRYGDHFTRLRDCKEKRRETNVKVYGVEYPSTLPDVKLKTKLTSRERYKTDYPTQSPEVKEKIKNTMLHRHGVTNPLKLDSVKSTVRDTNIKRYGVSAAILLPENITKRKASMRSKIIGMYSDILGKHNCDLIELIDSYNIKYKCNVCNSDMIESYLFINRCRVDRNVTPCSNCVPKVWGTSHIERELFNFVKSIAPDAIENSRKIISPYEVDIYIPSKNIAIEMNGLFYHNEMNVHDGYHLMKTELCEQRDIQLIHIYMRMIGICVKV